MPGHRRDPYHRVDARQSSRTVRLELDGAVVAESSRPVFVFETGLPIRFYLPREDVQAELTPTDRRTTCAYKGHASYFSIPGQNNVAWTYLEPADGVTQLAGLIAFFDDRLDVFIDGDRREHPRTVVAEAPLQEGFRARLRRLRRAYGLEMGGIFLARAPILDL